ENHAFERGVKHEPDRDRAVIGHHVKCEVIWAHYEGRSQVIGRQAGWKVLSNGDAWWKHIGCGILVEEDCTDQEAGVAQPLSNQVVDLSQVRPYRVAGRCSQPAYNHSMRSVQASSASRLWKRVRSSGPSRAFHCPVVPEWKKARLSRQSPLSTPGAS